MDTDDRRRILSVYMVVFGTTGFFLTGCVAIPVFESIPQHVKFLENTSTPIGTSLFILTANDRDDLSNVMTFSTNDAVTALYVNITHLNKTTPAMANITLKHELDRESNEDGIDLKFIVSDTKGNEGIKSVRLYILDVCDKAPEFDRSSYTLEINEVNTNSALLVFSEILASDRDNGINAMVTYTMEPKAESEYWKVIYNETFSIHPLNGSVYLLKNLDYENNSFYQFTLHAQDTCYLTAVPANLTIKVKDVQDKPPFFIGLPYMKKILESNYNKSHLLRVEAFDGDLGIPNKVEYSWINSSECSEKNSTECGYCRHLFELNTSTGDITVTGNLDWKLQDIKDIYGTCTIVVKAKEVSRDQTNPTEETESNTTVTVTIEDTNNNSPQFAKKSLKASIQENAAKKTPLVIEGGEPGIKVFDEDQGSNSRFTVRLTCENQTDCDTFEVIPSTAIIKEGIITIRVNNNSLLDYEERQNITLVVIATEEMNSTHIDTATVLVQIENSNEFFPKFTNETYVAMIQEGSKNQTLVTIIKATDNDANGSDEISYSLAGGNNLFYVDSKTGDVFTKCTPDHLDREKLQLIYLSIIATDQGGRMDQAQIIVNINDVNDNAPVFQNDRYTAILDETSTTFIDRSFLTVKATDGDEPGTNNSTVSYNIGSIGNFERHFTINNTTGDMSLVSALDYEAIDNDHGEINLTIFAYDHGTPQLSSNVTVTVLVQDVNDNAPQFSDDVYNGTIKENAIAGTLVAHINATDADKTERNKMISYFIQSGKSEYFQINDSTGVVLVKTYVGFDRETSSLYTLQIIAVDHGANQHTSTTTLSVTIQDVNNKLPKFKPINCSDYVYENETVRSLVTTCDAEDPDENASLIYSITLVNGWSKDGQPVDRSIIQSCIGIIEQNGTLYVNSTLDRETVAKMEMTIIVNDTRAEEDKVQTATATVTVTVLDVDDNPPRFTHVNDLRVGMRRTIELGKEIFDLKKYVTDEDSSQNGADKWKFEKFLLVMTSDLESRLSSLKGGERCNDPICVSDNGTIVNNMYYTQDMSGFFNITVLVKDSAGHDTTFILIFLIADSQVLKMTIYGTRTIVALMKDEILSDCSRVTDLLFVYDSIADHKADDGTLQTFKTDLFFHIQDHKNNKVLSAEEGKRLLDEYADRLTNAREKYNIVSIESSLKSENAENDSTKTTYVMVAVIALLTLVLLIVGYMFFSSSKRYKRKLRAAMPSETELKHKKKDDFVVPGSNIYAHKENPLLKTTHAPPGYEEVDATSHNSLDKNDVDDAIISHKDELEEREVTLDMFGEDYYTKVITNDPLEAALREHDAQKRASMHKLGDPGVGHSEDEDVKEMVDSGFVNNGFHHNLELETSEI